MTVSRRGFLRAVGTGAVSLAALSAPAAASTEHADAQPDHVSISYDQGTLETYRPRLVLEESDREKLIGLYGWTATSSEYDTDVHVYWTAYTHQEGVTSYDSHEGDHEPVYVLVDSETGAVREVVASVYHWLRGRTSTPPLDGDHPELKVISPWHQYTAASETGELFEVDDLTAVFDSWLSNGLAESLEPGTVYNPWTMAGANGREHWWRDDFASFSFNATVVSFWKRVGRGQAGDLDA